MKKLSLAVVATLAAVSAFAVGVPKIAHASNPCYQESIKTGNETWIGAPSTTIHVTLAVVNYDEQSCAGTYGEFYFYLGVGTSNGGDTILGATHGPNIRWWENGEYEGAIVGPWIPSSGGVSVVEFYSPIMYALPVYDPEQLDDLYAQVEDTHGYWETLTYLNF